MQQTRAFVGVKRVGSHAGPRALLQQRSWRRLPTSAGGVVNDFCRGLLQGPAPQDQKVRSHDGIVNSRRRHCRQSIGDDSAQPSLSGVQIVAERIYCIRINFHFLLSKGVHPEFSPF